MAACHFALSVLLLALVSTSASAQKQDLKVSIDGSSFARGGSVDVHVGLLGKTKYGTAPSLPKDSGNAQAWYQACTTADEKTVPNDFGSGNFCALKDQQTKVGQSKPESVDDIANGAKTQHTFSERLLLPESPAGTKLWVFSYLTYTVPGLAPGTSKTLVGSTYLLYRCDKAKPGSPKSTVQSCAYYTPGGFAIKKSALELPQKTVRP